MVFSLFWRRLGSQNHPQHKPDLTWNGKRRLFLCFLKEASWNGFGSQSFPNVPERSARFARCARSLAALAKPQKYLSKPFKIPSKMVSNTSHNQCQNPQKSGLERYFGSHFGALGGSQHKPRFFTLF